MSPAPPRKRFEGRCILLAKKKIASQTQILPIFLRTIKGASLLSETKRKKLVSLFSAPFLDLVVFRRSTEIGGKGRFKSLSVSTYFACSVIETKGQQQKRVKQVRLRARNELTLLDLLENSQDKLELIACSFRKPHSLPSEHDKENCRGLEGVSEIYTFRESCLLSE